MPTDDADKPSASTPDYLKPYNDAVRTFGPTFEATLWASKDKQLGRFAVIAQMAELTGRVVLDAGCALGDFAAWLIEHDLPFGRYIGIDAVAPVIERASSRGLAESVFAARDFAAHPEVFVELAREHRYDLAVFSGSLNTFDAEHAWRTVCAAYDAAAEGVVFNFLSARHHKANAPNPSPAKRFDPVPLLDRALELTPNVRFRQDYFQGHDATIAMIKPRAR
jgi:SAM-dependent methyltransferase